MEYAPVVFAVGPHAATGGAEADFLETCRRAAFKEARAVLGMLEQSAHKLAMLCNDPAACRLGDAVGNVRAALDEIRGTDG